MNIFCKIFGHKWMPITNPIGKVFKGFTLYERKIECTRCESYYLDNYIEGSSDNQKNTS